LSKKSIPAKTLTQRLTAELVPDAGADRRTGGLRRVRPTG
jgi:hypothetical protein